MEHSISPIITDTYNPKAENNYTLREWLNNKPSYRVLDSLSTYIRSGGLISCNTVLPVCKAHALVERINSLANSEEGFEIRAKVYIVTSMSIMFSVYAIIMSAITLTHSEEHKSIDDKNSLSILSLLIGAVVIKPHTHPVSCNWSRNIVWNSHCHLYSRTENNLPLA